MHEDSQRTLILRCGVAALVISWTGFGVAASTLAAPSASTRAGICPGTFRWEVKTLSDPRARLVNFTPAASTTKQLRALPRPAGIGPTTPRLRGAERRVYRLTVRTFGARVEADGDIHLVVYDPVGPAGESQTMIVEFPDPACDGAAHSIKRAQMARARAAFIRACGLPGRRLRSLVGHVVTLTGAGFFDKPHRAVGIAPNAIELHPVLSFRGSCKTPPPP